jgi:hypothetical protein
MHKSNQMKIFYMGIALLLVPLFCQGQTINQLGFYFENGIFALDAKGQYMVLGSGNIIDNADPSDPVLFSQYSFSGFGSSVLIDGAYCYVGTGMSNDLHIADLTNISFPLHKSSMDFSIGNGVFGMDLTGNTLLVALGSDGVVCSIDVTDKNNPEMLDTLYIAGGQCRDIVINGNYAFAAHEGGLKVLNITDPSDMQVTTTIGSGYNSIDFGPDRVFLGKSLGGIEAYDVSDPVAPLPVFSIPNTGGTAWDVKYRDDHIYLATNSNGLYIYQVEGNTATEMVNFPNEGNGQSFGVCLQDSLVLLSGLINGVAILQYNSAGTVGENPGYPEKQLNIFPNPALDYVVIEYEGHAIEAVEFIDMNGRIFKGQLPAGMATTVNISNLPSGQYLLRISANGKTMMEKLVVKGH